ncbi:MAG: EAL domain-containing protein [Gammaproteobacteria bacterium]|nr:EAL domain-containing protein [Gammaproteobacteria bacterium]
MKSSLLQNSLIKAIYAASPDGILVVDNKGGILSHNQRFVDIWQIPDDLLNGHEPGTAIGLDDAPILSACLTYVKDKSAFLERVKALYDAPDMSDFCEVELLDGRILERHSTPLNDNNGQSIGRAWFFRDITEHKEIKHGLTLNQFSLNHSQDAIFRTDQDGRIRYVNEAACKHLGYSREELLSLSIPDIDPEVSVESWNAYWKKVRVVGWRRFETSHKRKDGTIIPVEIVSNIMEFDDEQYSFASVRNISERKRSEQVLRTLAETGAKDGEDIFKIIVRQLASSHNMRYVLIGRVNPVTQNTIDTIAVWANDNFVDNFSYSLEDTPCQNVTQSGSCLYPDNVQELFPNDTLLADMRIRSYLGVPLKNKQHEVLGIIAMLDGHPMTEQPQTLSLLNSLAVRVSMELERKESDEKQVLSARIFNETHEGIIITSADGTIIDVNPTFTDITGYSREEALGQNSRILNSGRHNAEFYADMWQTLIEHGHWQGELWNRKKNGDGFAERLTITALKNDEGETSHYVCLFSDITQSKQQQEKLELMAHYDVLTRLPNRVLFADRFSQAIAHSKRTENLLAICFLDLDNFKSVNDNYGHKIGDQLLIEVAKRIQANIRTEDTVSRMGGDEFALLLGDIESKAQCERMLERILQAIAKPLLYGQADDVTTSIGVTLYPDDNADLDTLLRHADQAMYQAKILGRNRYHWFNSEEDQKTIEKHYQLTEIRQALTNNELCLFYQPKVNMKTGKVLGAEALIRWLHPEKGLILPLDFLPLVEGTDLEIQIGDWVIHEAIQQLNLWQQQGLELEISINISSYHLLSPPFIAELYMSLAKYPDIDSKYIQLEILESSTLGDLGTIKTLVKTCQNTFGVQIALDDFGTGYSSLNHLRSLSANTIKIDQSFVRNMLDDPEDYAIIEGIIGLAHAFNRQVVAEGVETTEHGLMLLKMGCEQAQGYGISYPLPVTDISEWLNNYRANKAWLASDEKVSC